MMGNLDYININKQAWNKKTDYHFKSEFYNVKEFIDGKNTLNSIELELLGDIKGKKILHLQCHFGQDSLSLSRMGALVTGVDFSEAAILKAKSITAELNLDATFICCDVYDLPNHLNEQFDFVFTSYGVIGWLPDLQKWANIVQHFLKPGGQFVMAEFHPVVWMFDADFTKIAYSYFNAEAIIETESGTYAEKGAPITTKTIGWNHSLEEVISNLLQVGLTLNQFKEYNYSPYNCFNGMEKLEEGQYQIAALNKKLPLVYSLLAEKM